VFTGDGGANEVNSPFPEDQSVNFVRHVSQFEKLFVERLGCRKKMERLSGKTRQVQL
jgi:hypothetical protein